MSHRDGSYLFPTDATESYDGRPHEKQSALAPFDSPNHIHGQWGLKGVRVSPPSRHVAPKGTVVVDLPLARTINKKKSFVEKVLERVGGNPSEKHDGGPPQAVPPVPTLPPPPADAWHASPGVKIQRTEFVFDIATGLTGPPAEISFRSSSPYTCRLPGVAITELIEERGLEDGEAAVADLVRIRWDNIHIYYRWHNLPDFCFTVGMSGIQGRRTRLSLAHFVVVGFWEYIQMYQDFALPPGTIRLGQPGSRLAFHNFRLVRLFQISPGTWLVDLAWVDAVYSGIPPSDDDSDEEP